jgi:hypothetical protein
MEAANPQRSKPGDRRLAVVSGYASRQLTPRGQRTQRLLETLGQSWDVELFALPGEEPSGGASPNSGRAPWRRLAGGAVRTALLDKWEPWSLRHLRGWQPRVDAALLIAYPWSPVAYAAARLRRAGIPYVADAGDPWVLTSPGTDTRLVAKARSRRAEGAIWAGASGGVLTTAQQAAVVSGFFPELPILVRPNGYDPLPGAGDAGRRPPGKREPRHLRLVHYGMLTFVRVDLVGLLERLAACGRWDSISFTQYGDDHAGMLERVPASIEVERRSARPWAEVLAEAPDYDLALVVGNWLTGQLPSKAVQYLTLPIPRLALSERLDDDALAEYVSGRPGWLALAKDDPDAAGRVWDHLERGWAENELAPPAGEAWPEVATQIAEFLERCVCPGGTPVPRAGDERIAIGRHGT